jgi:hypothetical protein
VADIRRGALDDIAEVLRGYVERKKREEGAISVKHSSPMNADTFRHIDGKPIYWRDKQDFVHSCEGANVHPGVRLIWTLCERDVPANDAYKCTWDVVTCATCRALEAKHD